MDKDKTIRVSDEIMEKITECKENNSSISDTISVLLDKYNPIDYISKENGKFILVIGDTKIDVPTFTPVNKIIRISPDVYDRLSTVRAYPDESFNMVLFRLVATVNTPYFDTPISLAARKYTEMLDNYVCEYVDMCEIDSYHIGMNGNFVKGSQQLNGLVFMLKNLDGIEIKSYEISTDDARKYVKNCWFNGDIEKRAMILSNATILQGNITLVKVLLDILNKISAC